MTSQDAACTSKRTHRDESCNGRDKLFEPRATGKRSTRSKRQGQEQNTCQWKMADLSLVMPTSRPLCLLILQVLSLLTLSPAKLSAGGQRTPASSISSQINQRTLTAGQQTAMGLLQNGAKGDAGDQQMGHKCAQHCTCSLVQTMDSAKGSLVNLTRATCESPLFSDVLTIDRRTQIIHISLPFSSREEAAGDRNSAGPADANSDSAKQSTGSPSPSSNASTGTSTSTSTNKRRQQIELMTKLLNLNVSAPGAQANRAADSPTGQGQHQFRMPRLRQFALLREIVIVNLRIEVCDSEIFKRNQRLLKLKWNHNQLKQVSKSCFRHLDTLLELNLDHNHLDELESALFSPLASLKHLSLAHNRLSELTAHQFANLTRLQSLNLVGNSFRLINLNLFEPMASSLQLLVLARNQISQFVVIQGASNKLNATTATTIATAAQVKPLAGVIFRNLIKLNVDFNKFERVKLLQLHRFFNVKFLSARGNNIASIRDKAFNGLKLVELNLAANKLASISRCAFCNSTIKRLNLAENNISMPLAHLALAAGPPPLLTAVAGAPPAASPSAQQLVAPAQQQAEVQQQRPLVLGTGIPPASSASMLVLSQSLLGPLFGHLEYLDLSHNSQLASQLETLLEPLLELQYLNLAATGLDRALPTPALFKNLRRLRYLNLSMNHLDQIVAETIEPLVELELLDMSQNDFSELDESFLVVLDELPLLKLVNLASNPWYCSQCKISNLYDWISRSPLYNYTCLAQQQVAASSTLGAPADQADPEVSSHETPQEPAMELGGEHQDSRMAFIYRHKWSSSAGGSQEQALARGPHDYSLLAADQEHPSEALDFDLILELFEGDASSTLLGGNLDEVSGAPGAPPAGAVPNYQLVPQGQEDQATSGGPSSLASQFRDKKRQLSERLLRSLASSEDDESMGRTLATLPAASRLASGQLNLEASDRLLRRHFGRGADFCLKCEFPSELRSFNLHELAPADFKYCAGSAPRFAASEPRIGLTLAIVIIGALFVVIIVVIVMYRKKSNTYYPGEELADQLESGHQEQSGLAGKRPVLSVSSDVEHQYGDQTDYSSPPMSQSYSAGEESYTDRSQGPAGGADDEEEEDDEDEYDDEEEEEEEEDFDEDEEEGGEKFDEDDQQEPDGGGASLPTQTSDSSGSHQRQDSTTQPAETHPKARFEEEKDERPSDQQEQVAKSSAKSRQHSRQLSTSRSKSTTSGANLIGSHNQNSHDDSSPGARSDGRSISRNKQASLNRSQQGGHPRDQASRQTSTSSRQLTRNDRDDSTPIYIGSHRQAHRQPGGAALGGPGARQSLERPPDATPTSLSAADLLVSGATGPSLAMGGEREAPADARHHRAGHTLTQMASLADSLHGSHSRAVTRAQRREKEKLRADGELGDSPSANADHANSSLSRAPEFQQRPVLAGNTAPKTILHQRQQQQNILNRRQSSEQHSPGSVSFAAPPTTHNSGRQQQPSAGDSLRRDRLQRTSQTICVDQPAGVSPGGRRAAGATGHAGGVPSSALRSSGATRRQPRHQMTTLAAGSDHESSRGPAAQPSRNTLVSQASNGRTLVEFSSASPWPQQQAPPLHVHSTQTRPIDLGALEFAAAAREPTSSGGTPSDGGGGSGPQAASFGFGAAQVPKAASGVGVAGRPTSLRGRPLVKQPHPHLAQQENHQVILDSRPGQCAKTPGAQVQEQIIRFEGDEDEDSSLALDVAQLADLPSDLDEADLDQMLLEHTGTFLAANESAGVGAFEPLDADRQGVSRQDGARELMVSTSGSHLMSNSHSTHSALTQTGSRDFES